MAWLGENTAADRPMTELIEEALYGIRRACVVADRGMTQSSALFVASTSRRKSQPALASHSTSGLPCIVQRNGFAIVALK
jgi:hypothetical protein